MEYERTEPQNVPGETDPTVRLGIIGLGDFGREHLRAATLTAGVVVAAVADVDEQVAAAVSAEFEVPRWFSDPEELIGYGGLDGVIVVTPAHSHLALTRAAVDRGLGVLVEKPVLSALDQAADMAACAEQGLVLPAHILRFMEPYRRIHAELSSPDAPKIGGLSGRRHRNIDHISRFPHQDPLLMTMIHDIDQAMWLTGSRAVTATASSRSVRGGVNPDLFLATVIDEQDRRWDFSASWLLDGQAVPDWLEVYTDRGIQVASSGDRPDLGAGLIAEISHFATCLAHRLQSDIVSVKEAVHGIEIAEAIQRSARNGGRICDVS